MNFVFTYIEVYSCLLTHGDCGDDDSIVGVVEYSDDGLGGAGVSWGIGNRRNYCNGIHGVPSIWGWSPCDGHSGIKSLIHDISQPHITRGP